MVAYKYCFVIKEVLFEAYSMQTGAVTFIVIFRAVILLAVCDANLIFFVVVCKWPAGCCHDSFYTKAI